MKRDKRKVFSFNSELYKVTGIQKVVMDIHHAISDTYDAKIVGTISYNCIHKDLVINRNEYVRFVNPFMFYGSIVILHERKFLLLFWLLNHLLFQNIRLVYIHHNVFYNHKTLSIMPNTVVAISNEGVNNLNTYFKVPIKNIHKIYNCVNDVNPPMHKPYVKNSIKILYPARINEIKRQLEVVKRLKGNLSKEIEIWFAGEGPLSANLKEEMSNDSNFKYLGYRSDIYKLLSDCDYMMLFSKQEGLPITLIEASMMGLPILCNNVGGNSEIVTNNQNGFIFNINDWESLINQINELKNISPDDYQKMCNQSRLVYENNFTFNKFKQNYLKLFQSLES